MVTDTSGRSFPVDGQTGVPGRSHRQASVQPQSRYEYRYDQYTGTRYQVEVPVTPQQQDRRVLPSTAPGHLYPHPQHLQQQLGPPVRLPWQSPVPRHVQVEADPDKTMAQRIQDSVKGIVSIVENGGTTKSLKLVDFAKRCPAKWSKNAKLDSMNLSLYGYAAMAEIEASLSGKTETYPEGELLARLRHVKNVFEVCCLNSSEKDFTAYGWTLARDYSSKVMNKVAQGETSWQSMPVGVQTADLLLAQCDYPRPLQKGPVKEKENPNDPKKEKFLCTTWNSCTTEGKCEYEVANPGRECNRKHECSWCRRNLRQGFKHQKVLCKKRDDAGH